MPSTGPIAPEDTEWRFNVVSRYTFNRGQLKGWAIGGAMHWQDKSAIGYRVAIIDGLGRSCELALFWSHELNVKCTSIATAARLQQAGGSSAISQEGRDSISNSRAARRNSPCVSRGHLHDLDVVFERLRETLPLFRQRAPNPRPLFVQPTLHHTATTGIGGRGGALLN